MTWTRGIRHTNRTAAIWASSSSRGRPSRLGYDPPRMKALEEHGPRSWSFRTLISHLTQHLTVMPLIAKCSRSLPTTRCKHAIVQQQQWPEEMGTEVNVPESLHRSRDTKRSYSIDVGDRRGERLDKLSRAYGSLVQWHTGSKGC